MIKYRQLCRKNVQPKVSFVCGIYHTSKHVFACRRVLVLSHASPERVWIYIYSIFQFIWPKIRLDTNPKSWNLQDSLTNNQKILSWLWILDHFENRLSISRMCILFKSWLYASVPFFVVSHVTTTYLQVLLVSSLTPDNCMLKTLFNIELCYWRLFSQSLLVQITAITCQEFLELHRTNQKFF